MIKAIVSDFSRVILSSKDNNYDGKINGLHEKLLLKDANYNFWNYFVLNQELLEFYNRIKNELNIYIFTSRYVQQHPPLKEKLEGIFKDIFISTDLGVKKIDREAYLLIADKIGLDTSEVLLIDDRQINIDVAKEVGMATILFKTNKETIKNIENIIQ